MDGWLVGFRVHGRLSHAGPRLMAGVPSVGVLRVTRISEKATENSKRLGRQARPLTELGTFRLTFFSAGPLSHWWDLRRPV